MEDFNGLRKVLGTKINNLRLPASQILHGIQPRRNIAYNVKEGGREGTILCDGGPTEVSNLIFEEGFIIGSKLLQRSLHSGTVCVSLGLRGIGDITLITGPIFWLLF